MYWLCKTSNLHPFSQARAYVGLRAVRPRGEREGVCARLTLNVVYLRVSNVLVHSSTVLRCSPSGSWSLTPLWAATLTQYRVCGLKPEIVLLVVNPLRNTVPVNDPRLSGSLIST